LAIFGWIRTSSEPLSVVLVALHRHLLQQFGRCRANINVKGFRILSLAVRGKETERSKKENRTVWRPACLPSNMIELTDSLRSSAEYAALDDLRSSDLTAEVKSFSKPTADVADNQQKVKDAIWNAYNVILAVAANSSSSDQERLVKFVTALRKEQIHTSSGPLKEEDGVVWKDLPTFGWAVRDAFNFCKPFQ
jgi:hypothetical protein